MSFNLANRSLSERAMIEDEKARLYELWQSNLGKAKADAAGQNGCAPNWTACHRLNTPIWYVPK
jgi:hypothetical protein